jgi:NADH-quinone oxidoreductase subunit L
VAILSTVLALAAIGISWLLYGRKPLQSGQEDPLQKGLGFLFTGMNHKWYVDEIYEALFIGPYKRLAHFLAYTLDWRFWHDWFHNSVIVASFRGLVRFLANPIDLGIIDGISRSLADTIQSLGNGLSFLESGYVRNYALSLFLGVVVILGYLIFFT